MSAISPLSPIHHIFNGGVLNTLILQILKLWQKSSLRFILFRNGPFLFFVRFGNDIEAIAVGFIAS